MSSNSLPAAALALACSLAAATQVPRVSYTIETIAGGDRVGDNGPAVAAQLSEAQGIAVDRAGNLYIADTDNHRVRKVTPAGIITTLAGTGYPGLRGDGGAAETAQLNAPYGLAADASGNVYIADLGNNRVRRVTPTGIISTYAGTGHKGSSGDGGQATDAELMSPRNLAMSAAGVLYISEFDGHRVRKVAPGGIITTVAGTGMAGFKGDTGPAVAAQLAYPAGLAIDPTGVLYIADTRNQRVRKVLPSGIIVTALGAPGNESLNTPIGLAADSGGNIFVAERHAWVRRFTPAGSATVVAGTGTAGYDGDGHPASTALISQPADVAVDASGSLYIVDQTRIRKVGPTGIINTIVGDAFQRFIGDGGPATAALFSRPRGLSLDVRGDLYIADTGTQRIRKLSGGTVATVAGTGKAAFEGDGGPAPSAAFNGPSGIAADAFGAFWVADTDNQRLRQVTQSLVRTIAGSDDSGLGADGDPAEKMPLSAPLAVLADNRGNVYVADSGNNRVLVKNPAGIMTTLAGNGSPGYSGDGGRATQAQLNGPIGLALDAAGNLYIADTLNHRIRKVSADTGYIATVAGNGQAGFSGDGGPALQAMLSHPRGVAVDGDGNLYVTDSGNQRVRLIAADGGIRTIAGGEPGFSGDGGPAADALLNNPWAIVLDGSGNLYVSDSFNNRVRKMTPFTEPAPIEQTLEISIRNAASLREGPVAAGEMVSIFGAGLAADEAGFDGLPAPVFLTKAGQINVAGSVLCRRAGFHSDRGTRQRCCAGLRAGCRSAGVAWSLHGFGGVGPGGRAERGRHVQLGSRTGAARLPGNPVSHRRRPD